jgi:hypothetical protein
MPEIGATLREARMRARIDISEIEAETKIRAKYLRALENEEWDLLPGPTFVKSFLRTYAEALDLDAKLLLEEYKLRHDRPSEQELLPISPRTTPGRRAPAPRPRIPRGVVIGVLLAGLLAVLFVLGSDEDEPDGRPNTIQAAPPADTTPLTTTTRRRTQAPRRRRAATSSKLVRLQIIPSAPVYVCLEAAGNRRPLNGVTLQPGGSQPTFRSSKFRLTLGNGNATLRIDGKVREVGEVTNGIGWVITKGNRKVLSPRARPNCVG